VGGLSALLLRQPGLAQAVDLALGEVGVEVRVDSQVLPLDLLQREARVDAKLLLHYRASLVDTVELSVARGEGARKPSGFTRTLCFAQSTASS